MRGSSLHACARITGGKSAAHRGLHGRGCQGEEEVTGVPRDIVDDDMGTLMVECEAIVIQRLLVPMSVDFNDYGPLTPMRYLVSACHNCDFGGLLRDFAEAVASTKFCRKVDGASGKVSKTCCLLALYSLHQGGKTR